VIVMKFGGTSVADRAAIERLISIVRAARRRRSSRRATDWRGPVVVVSALGGATDRLLGVAADAGAGDVEGAQANVRRSAIGTSTSPASSRTRPSAPMSSAFINDAEFDELERAWSARWACCAR
jgi:aspartate kinase